MWPQGCKYTPCHPHDSICSPRCHRTPIVYISMPKPINYDNPTPYDSWYYKAMSWTISTRKPPPSHRKPNMVSQFANTPPKPIISPPTIDMKQRWTTTKGIPGHSGTRRGKRPTSAIKRKRFSTSEKMKYWDKSQFHHKTNFYYDNILGWEMEYSMTKVVDLDMGLTY